MRNYKSFITLGLLISTVFLQSCSQKKRSAAGEKNIDSLYYTYYTVNDYKWVKKYDTHVHILTDDTTFIKQSEADNFRLLDINVDVAEIIPIEKQREIAIKDLKKYPGEFSFATTFTVKNWNDPHWLQKTMAYLKESFAQGAIAVKIWKNIGMELKDKNGRYVMIDDPRFDPILNYLAKNNIPVIGHLGEPKEAWLPISQMIVKGDVDYFTAHPQYHNYLHPEFPKYEEIINARDHMLEKHPDLTFVGAHLGSLEWSVDELAKRLDKFPNMAVDMAERIPHLQHQSIKEWQRVRDFFIKYQDRLLYGTDLIVDGKRTPEEMKKHAYDIRIRIWKYFVTDEKMTAPELLKGEFRGLKLPRNVIDKIYRKNAEKWLHLGAKK